MTKLWHDDVRCPPDESWTWARTNTQAREILSAGGVTEASLDHDMGGHAMDAEHPRTMFFKGHDRDNGVELVRWMINERCVPHSVRVHSWNQPGAERMRRLLELAGHDVRLEPFVPPGSKPVCEVCGKPKHPQRTKFCSDRCREMAKQARMALSKPSSRPAKHVPLS